MRFRHPCAIGLAALAACALACTNTVTAGLELVIDSNLTPGRDYDAISLKIQQQNSDGSLSPALIDQPFILGTDTTLPTSFAVAAGSSKDQVVIIELLAMKDGTAVDQRVVQVQVPTTRVAELTLLLTAACYEQVNICPGGKSCNPIDGVCASNVVSTPLPTYDGGEIDHVDAAVGTTFPDGDAPSSDSGGGSSGSSSTSISSGSTNTSSSSTSTGGSTSSGSSSTSDAGRPPSDGGSSHDAGPSSDAGSGHDSAMEIDSGGPDGHVGVDSGVTGVDGGTGICGHSHGPGSHPHNC